MDRNTNSWKDLTLGNPQEEPPKRIEKRKRKKHRVLWWLISVIVIIGACTVATMWDANRVDVLWRSVIYARAEKDENGCALLYQYNSDTTGHFGALRSGMVSVSRNQLQLINESGQSVVNESVRLQEPELVSNGNYAVAYDVGGNAIYVLADSGIVWQTETEGDILSVTLNEQNYVTVTLNKSGYKAAVYVFDALGNAVYEFDSSQRFCMTACTSRDGRYLAILTLGHADGGFASYAVLYRMSETEAICTTELADSLVYDLRWIDSRFCAISEDALYFIDTDGRVSATYLYGGDYLRRGEISDGGFAALLLSQYKSGSQVHLTLVDSEGQMLCDGQLDGEVLSMSAAGRYVAVLYCDRLVIYDKTLALLADLPDISEARQVIMRSDGSAILVGATTARLYLP